MPGRIEAENFDKGDDGTSFHEVAYPSDPTAIENAGMYSTRRWDPGNLSNVEQFRATAVDIEQTGDSVTRADGKNFQVAYTAKNEWLKYTVNVNATKIKDYQFTIRYSRGASADSLPGMVSIEVDGTKYADSLRLFGTGTWGTYANAIADTIPLTPGSHEIKINFIDAGKATGGSVANVNYIDVKESLTQREKFLKLNLNFGIKSNLKNKPQTAVVKGKKLKRFGFFRIFMHSSPIELASGICDSLGDFSQLITLPQNTTPGKHSIDVSTLDSAGEKIAESAYITVDAFGVITEIINAGTGNDAPSGLTLTYSPNTDTDTANTVIAKISAVDYSRDIHTYTLTAGEGDADNALFAIASDSLILKSVADFEGRSEYRVRIRATDNAENTFDTVLVIQLIDGNDEAAGIKKPEISDNVTISMKENEKDVTTIFASDPKDLSIKYQYSIGGGMDAERFRILPSSGKLQFILPPDFENPSDSGADNSYEVVVEALNLFDQTLSYQQTINVNIGDTLEIESPVIINLLSTNIEPNAARVGATIVGGGASITKRGFLYAFTDGPTEILLSSENVSRVDSGSGDGVFTADLSELSENALYTYRAFATTGTDTIYSEQLLLTTLTSSNKPVVNYDTPVKLKQNSESSLKPNVISGDVPEQPYKYVTTVAGTGVSGDQNGAALESTLSRPFGIAINSIGQVFVADAFNHQIRYFTVGDSVKLLAGSTAGVNNEDESGIIYANAQFNQPTGIVTDNQNNIYISDKGNNQIRKISLDGNVYRIAGADKIGSSSNSGDSDGVGVAATFNQPEGLAIDRAGQYLYVADRANHIIRRINLFANANDVVTFAGSGTAGNRDSDTLLNAEFNEPTGLYLDESNNLYVTEAKSHRVRKINLLDETITTLAGSGAAGSADGSGVNAEFSSPASITGDGLGNLYVADLGNNKIRKIDTAGSVSTYAGTGIAGSNEGKIENAKFDGPYGIILDQNASVIYVSHSAASGNKISSIGLGGYVLADSLPAGLSFDRATGTISGAPTFAKADTTYKVYYANMYGEDSTIINIEVVANNKKITYATPQVYQVPKTITPLVPVVTGGTFSGGVNGTFTISPALPRGLAFDTATGTISGKPEEEIELTDFYVSGWDSTESVVTKLSIQVDPPDRLTITGTLVVLSKTYDGTVSATVTPGTLSGYLDGEDVQVDAEATYESSSVSKNKRIVTVYTLKGADAEKYRAPLNDTVTNGEITAIQLIVSAPTLTKTKVYNGDTTAAVTAGSLSGVLDGETVTVSAIAKYETKTVGTAKKITIVYTLGGANAANYSKPVDTLVNDGVITAKQLTIAAPTLTKTKVYDGDTTAAVTAGTLVGVVGSDDVKVSAIAKYDTKTAGTGKKITTVYSISGADTVNYKKPTDTLVNDGEITTKQLTISAPTLTKSKEYDGDTTAAVTAGTLVGVVGSDDVKVSAIAKYETKIVGTGKKITTVYSINGADAINYKKPVDTLVNDGVITAKQLTISAPSITLKKTIDGNTTATVQAGSLSGVESGDQVTVAAVAEYDTPDLGENKKIVVVYSLGGTDKDNYVKPVKDSTDKGMIVDFPPTSLAYTPSSQVSALNKTIVDMLPSSGGGKVVSYAIAPALQPGLVFDTATGKISGTRTSINGGGSGSVEYTVTATNSGGSTTAKVTIIYNVPATNITLSKANLYEGNQVGEIIGSLTSTDPDAGDTHTYTFASGDGDTDNGLFSINGDKLLAGRVFNYRQGSSYSIRLRTTDQEGMSFEKMFTITISPKPVVVGQSSSQYYSVTTSSPVISLGTQSQLQVTGNGIASVQWSPATGLSNPNILNPIARPKRTTTYTVTITNTLGSVTTLQITIEVKDDYLVEAPNVITPNGDGINDFWTIKNLEEYPDNEVTVYNRDGKILFKAANYNQRWDGKVNGRPLATGTYYYMLRFPANPKVIHKGFITIVN
ncbi:MAG: YDG domain-containing protein [bacterium]